MPGWERLLTSRDAAHRAALRVVLTGAISDHDEMQNARDEQLLKAAEIAVQRGVAQAFT